MRGRERRPAVTYAIHTASVSEARGGGKRVAAAVEREIEREIILNDRPRGVTEARKHIKTRRHCSGDKVKGVDFELRAQQVAAA